MKALSSFAAALLLSMSLTAGSAQATTARELLPSCDAALRSLHGSGEDVSIAPAGRVCWTYMQAVQDMAALADEGGHRLLNICLPENGRTDGVLRAFTKYAHAHPRQLNSRASVVALQGLGAAFPCK